ncbi:MAG: methylated-DNA--[protein]-cysteine S-methyltransferase [Sphingomonas sp.]
MAYARDWGVVTTPIGSIRIEGDDRYLDRIAILTQAEPGRRPDRPALLAAAEQLEAFFAGALRDFDLALKPAATPRGHELRQGLVDVRFGSTLSYGGLARALNSSPRAIGQLCSRNPFPIVVPCHRILATGAIGHYSAGSGIPTKQWLLDHERRLGDPR